MAMKRMMVRYTTKPERADENARLIEKVFQELREKAPNDVRYLALRVGDRAFVHLVEDGGGQIPRLEAFQTFRGGVKERCAEPPQQDDVTIIGNYRMLGDD
jgi:hypothetical protein